MTREQTWDNFRERHLAHMHGAIGFDDGPAAIERLWRTWCSRELARADREARAASAAPETRFERIARCAREDVRRRQLPGGLDLAPDGSPLVVATEMEIARARERCAAGRAFTVEDALRREGLFAMRGAL